jgi:CSLREA domain-containing protein
MRMRLLIAGLLAMFVSLLFAAGAMAGIRVTVNTTADPLVPITPDGQCSLREAIGASNTSTTVGTADCPTSGSPSENQIGFDPALGVSPVVNLNLANPPGGLTFLNNDVTVTGPATVNGADDSGSRVITSSNVNLTLTSLTITNGSENVEGLGGGIKSTGRLFLNNSTVTGNSTTKPAGSNIDVEGGGIYSTGPVALTNSSVTNNQATANCTPCTGTGIALGGGVEVNGDDLTMENSVASGNKAIATADSTRTAEADGGGVRTDGTVLIEHSTISGNSTTATNMGTGPTVVQGAGMLFHNPAGTIDVELSTIANNLMKAAGDAAIAQRGGGIENFDASTANYISDTIAGNGIDPISATGGVEGLNFQSANIGAGSRTFENTIIANPVGSAGTNCFGDTPYSVGTQNLEFPTAISDACFASALHADPQLGALEPNGGLTPTMLPAVTSPVIDQGSAADQKDINGDPDTTEDQRGLTRPVVFPGLAHPFDGSDIGAVEVQQTCPGQATPGASCTGPPPPPPPPGPTGQRAAALKKCKKFKGKAKAKKRKNCIKRAKKLPV